MGSNWKTARLLDQYEVRSGLSKPAKDFGTGYPFLTFKDVFYNYFTPEVLGDLVESTDKERDGCSVKRGDVFLTRTSETMNELGMSCVALKDYEGATFNGFCKRLRPNEQCELVPEYVGYYLRSPKFRQAMLAFSTMSTRASLNNEMIGRLEISYPPKEAQRHIAHVLKTLDNKITLNRQINQTLEQMAQTLFKSWFVDFDPVMDNALDAGNPIPDELQHRAEARKAVRESEGFKPLPDDVRQLFPDAFEESELGWVPKGWMYQSFGSLLASTIGGDWGKDVQDEKHTVQSRIVRGTDIPDLISGQLSNAPLRWVEPKKLKSRQIERGDIIIEVSGGSPKQPTGRSLFMTDSMLERLGSIIEPASFCRRFKPNSFNIGMLASLHLQKIYADGKTWEYQNQSTGIANFQTKFFLEAEMVLIPSDKVLEAFCRIVTPLVEKSQNNEQIALAKLRDTLLPKLISGELRLDDVEAAVEQETVSA
ncbi:TPA: restriction endonuclease subunit S [Vibrio parahaemolyticus]|nr:restriction endonuclease subunit S [Vibrio parahaemolyticus]HCH4198764.1 restriction endonuclease subunit S [Vibrio parahaemolyticus]HCM1283930.1 restriction endonuclease subunit S [Vibrio parahaemolyticus]HCM1285554.1 restriction endonuclease subunit S [Vibrio parahaemolyticus]